MATESKLAVYGAMGGNIAIAAVKFVAAGITGSSAMLSEGIHSLVDTGDSALLLLGMHLSKKPPDRAHPFGHGKEIYFWSLIVAVMIFGVGGGMSVYEGVTHLQHPTPPKDPTWNYWILGIAFVIESISLTIGLHQFRREKPPHKSAWQTLSTSKDPTLFTVLVEDSAAIAGLVFAFAGVWVGDRLQSPYPDGIASIAIGLLLMVVAVLLIHQSRTLLLGEGAEPDDLRAIEAAARDDPDVEAIRDPMTMYFGPNHVMVAMGVRFRRNLDVEQLERAIDRLEKAIHDRLPNVRQIFIEANAFRGGGRDTAGTDGSREGIAEGSPDRSTP